MNHSDPFDPWHSTPEGIAASRAAFQAYKAKRAARSPEQILKAKFFHSVIVPAASKAKQKIDKVQEEKDRQRRAAIYAENQRKQEEKKHLEAIRQSARMAEYHRQEDVRMKKEHDERVKKNVEAYKKAKLKPILMGKKIQSKPLEFVGEKYLNLSADD